MKLKCCFVLPVQHLGFILRVAYGTIVLMQNIIDDSRYSTIREASTQIAWQNHFDNMADDLLSQ